MKFPPFKPESLRRGGMALLVFILCEGTLFAADEPAGVYTDKEGRVMLQAELAEFDRYVEFTMDTARKILIERKVAAAELKVLADWQNAQKEQFKDALRQSNPVQALIDAWAVSASLTRHMSQTDSLNELPAAAREVALDMLKRREDRLIHIVSRYLPDDSVTSISQSINAFATEKPISATGSDPTGVRRWTAPLFSVWAKSQETAGSLFQIPLMPGRALIGVSDSGKALSGIRETTAEAVQVASQLPERIRTEFQIALADLVEKREEIIELLNAMDSVSTNLRATVESGSLTAAEIQKSMVLARDLLPAGESLATAVERAVDASTELVKTIGEGSDRPAAAGDGERKGFDIAEYRLAAATITSAASEVHQVLVEFRGLMERDPDAEPKEESSQFDIRDYGTAAESIQLGTAELRALLSELREITEDEEFSRRVEILVGRTAGRTEGVIDHFAWKLIQVIAAAFVLACGYTFFRMKCMQSRN